jgi:hypothetical protein
VRGRGRCVRRVAAAVGATLLAFAPAAASAADRWFAVPVSVANSGPAEPTSAGWMGGGGHSAYFATTAALLPEDTDTGADVYRRDGAVLTLASGSGPSSIGNAHAVSADGSSVVFQTTDALSPDDTDDEQPDLYETTDGVTRLVSASAPGALPSFLGFYSGILDVSANGRFVAFSTTDSLTPADSDSRMDVYVWDRDDGQARLASAGGFGVFDAAVSFGSMASDGSHVFFTTSEPLCCADSGFSNDIYDYATATRTLSLASPGTSDAVTYGGISADGTHAYYTTFESLAGDSDGGSRDVYQFAGGTTTLISTAAGFTPEDFDADFHKASADGSVVYITTPEKLATGDDDGNTDDIYKRTAGGGLSLVSTGPAETLFGIGPIFSDISPDGGHAFFYTAQDLTAGDSDGASTDAFDRSGPTTTRLSVGEQNDTSFDDASFAGFSADLSRIFFQTSGRWDAADSDGFDDLYARHAGHTALVTPGGACTLLPSPRCEPVWDGHSTDGTRVWFNADQDLSPLDGDGSATDVYESRLAVPGSVHAAGSALALDAGAPPAALDDGLTVSDPYDDVFGATVHVADGTIGYADRDGIAGSLNPAGDTLTLTGRATDADYQAALRSVTYRSAAAGSRDASFRVDNGAGPGAAAVRAVKVSGPPAPPGPGPGPGPGTPPRLVLLHIGDSGARLARLGDRRRFVMPGLRFTCPRLAKARCKAFAAAVPLGSDGPVLALGSLELAPGARSHSLVLMLRRGALADLQAAGRLRLSALTSFRSAGATGAVKATRFRLLPPRR